jgi:rod shape-determining protein MreD
MKILLKMLLIVLALLLQGTWVHKISVLGLRPDIVLLVLVYIGISGGQVQGALFGFCSGILLDIYDPQALGVNALTNSLTGFAVGYSRVGVVAEDLRVQVLILFLASLLHDTVYYTLYSLSTPSAILPMVVRYGLGCAVYTACVGTVLFVALSLRFGGGVSLDARRLYG